jgi:Fur family ferric uptake transcriptional regulator
VFLPILLKIIFTTMDHHSSPASEAVAALLESLQERGCRVTAPRRLIIEELRGAGRCLTPQELYAALRARHPQAGVGLTTVYRTLELLVELGAAQRFAQPNHEDKYIFCSPRHHHHMICSRCGYVEEVEGCLMPLVEAALRRDTRFQIKEHALDFYGLCQECQAAPQARSRQPETS